ncbi:putative ankyrin repeat protein [Acanthamoeba polyphaga mimivirus]|uniref:Putative ankyrin repeat protein n=1 Tax=Acanthamoeba polyphaga mimivirus TaxID=212035 RepID=A0A0G2XZK7_MIMIV|nr:putative ankyrin repeat protein [Acanthamoeba polyphaga mimivirus]
MVSRGTNIRVDDEYTIRLTSRKRYLEVVEFLVSQSADNDYAVTLSF